MSRTTWGPDRFTHFRGKVRNSLNRFVNSELLGLLMIVFQNHFKSFSKSAEQPIGTSRKRVKAAKANSLE